MIKEEEAIKILEEERMSLRRLAIDSNIPQLKSKYEAIDMAIKALKAQQWTPCSEKLPEVMEEEFDTLLANGRKRVISFSDSVYVTLKLKKSGEYVVKEAILMNNEWVFHFSPDEDMNSLSDYGEVIAWKPLPEPYKGGDTE